DRKGNESYQLLLGGSGDEATSQAKIAGPGFSEDGIVDAVERAVEQCRAIREPGERFIDTYRRVGTDGFKEAIYGRGYAALPGRSGPRRTRRFAGRVHRPVECGLRADRSGRRRAPAGSRARSPAAGRNRLPQVPGRPW